MSSTLDDIADVRQKAAAILSGHKLRQLEDAGLMVVEQAHYREMIDAAWALVRRYMLGKHSARDVVRLQALEAMERG